LFKYSNASESDLTLIKHSVTLERKIKIKCIELFDWRNC